MRTLLRQGDMVTERSPAGHAWSFWTLLNV